MELRHLRSFVAVATAGTVTRAAAQLNLAQPAVSQHVQTLELELGVLLFHRAARGMVLTEAGLALLGPARTLLAGEAEARSSVQRLVYDARVEVQIATIPTAAATLFPHALRLLASASEPFRLRVFERPTGEALALLSGRLVEAAIVRDPGDHSGFELELLVRERLVLVVPVGHRLLMKGDRSLHAFRGEPFVVFEQAKGKGLHRAAMDACARAGFVPRIVCEGPEIGSMAQIIAGGAAVGIMPVSVVPLLRGAVAALELDEPPPESDIYLARLPGSELSPSAARVARAIRRSASAFQADVAGYNESP
jgi:DNA-binding transcriptional LysR family regulator